jgi:hypothetical protein
MASEIKVDTVSEKTSGSGVTIDGLLIKDGGISGDVSLAGTTPTFTIGDAGAEDAALVFDGNAQDFYIALDDSADDLVIGLGSAVGTTPMLSFTEGGAATFKNVGTGDDNPMVLTLQTSETDLAQDDVIGKISFQAPDEGTGTDAILVSAAIQARAEGDHSSSSNATSIDFLTGASEAAAKKLSITSAGHFVPGADNTYDIGTASLEFKDGYFDGTLHCDVIDLAGTEYTAIASTMNALTDVSMDITNFVDGLLIQTDTDGSAPGTGTLSSATGNIGIGKDVFAALTDGTYNLAIGYQAADALTGGDDNIMIGKEAGGATTTGNDNVYIGLVANGATENVAVGNGALKVLTDAKYSVGVGHDAGKAITTGFGNTCIGWNNGVQSTTGDYNTYLGYGAGATASDTTRAIAIGQDVRAASNDFSFGKTSNVVTNDFDADADWSRSSDERLKTNIEDSTLGLEFIKDLRPVKFKWKPSTDVPQELTSEYHEENQKNLDVTMHGFIAQEVKAAIDTHGDTTFGGWHLDKGDGKTQRTKKNMFIMPLINAVKELSAKVDTLETENTALKARVKTLEDA